MAGDDLAPSSSLPAPAGGGALPPDAERLLTRGLYHLRRGEAAMPYSLAIPEEKAPPGTDVLLALLSLATVATSRALRQTRWIEEYRTEVREALVHLDKAAELAPAYGEIHYRRAQALRYLGEPRQALDAAREAARCAPENRDYAALVRTLEGAATRRTLASAAEETNRVLTWDDVILPAKTKRELRQMQLMLENPRQAQALGVEPPTGLLLYGPPGTGKTTVARVLAAQAKCHFLTSNPAEINNMWVGESEKAVQKLFQEARATAPSIVFLDEVDALISTRSGGVHQYSDKVVNQFLHEMDGLQPNQGVFVVGATNRPDMLDAALLRGGRLSRQIEIPLPDFDARVGLLKLHMRRAQVDSTVDLDVLAVQTEGFSGADLRALVNEAGLQALIRIADEGGTRAVTASDFQIALENLRRG